MKRRIALGFLIAAILLGVLLSLVGHEDVAADLAAADPGFLAMSFGAGLLALTFRGLVWTQFLRAIDERMSYVYVAGVFLSAMFIKYVTPYGQVATEPFVAYLVARDADMAYEDGFAGILSADVLNYLPYYTFGFAAAVWIIFAGAFGADIQNYLLAFISMFGMLVGLTYVVLRRQRIVYVVILRLVSVIESPLGRIRSNYAKHLSPEAVRDRLDNFYYSIAIIATDRRMMVVSAAYAHLGMAFLMAPVYLGGRALGYEIALPIVVLAVALGKLGMVVPAPGGLGGVEGFVTATLVILASMSPSAAFSVALIYRVSTYWLTIVVGGTGSLLFVLRR